MSRLRNLNNLSLGCVRAILIRYIRLDSQRRWNHGCNSVFCSSRRKAVGTKFESLAWLPDCQANDRPILSDTVNLLGLELR